MASAGRVPQGLSRSIAGLLAGQLRAPQNAKQRPLDISAYSWDQHHIIYCNSSKSPTHPDSGEGIPQSLNVRRQGFLGLQCHLTCLECCFDCTSYHRDMCGLVSSKNMFIKRRKQVEKTCTDQAESGRDCIASSSRGI